MVERLVYLCAYAIDTDETILGVTLDHDEQADLGRAMVLQPDGTSTLDPELAAPALFGACDPADVERALLLLRPHGGDTFTPSNAGFAAGWAEKLYAPAGGAGPIFAQLSVGTIGFRCSP